MVHQYSRRFFVLATVTSYENALLWLLHHEMYSPSPIMSPPGKIIPGFISIYSYDILYLFFENYAELRQSYMDEYTLSTFELI